MSEDFYGFALWIVVAWPLLLAIPALHARLPWPCHLAIMPAAVLAVLPGDASMTLPWFLFGTGFAVDAGVRWILVMSVAVWFTTATIVKSRKDDPTHDRATPFFMLTLAGNLGAVLAADLVGFFSFSALMGYGFYGLLVQDGDDKVQRAGRLYLIFLIIADLALFEALLIAAFSTGDLRFEAVRQVMAGTSSLRLYLWMALAGFALKAGAWPFHLWLLAVFQSASPTRTMLLGGVPVAMGLLGAVRWLPFGEHAFNGFGMVIQLLGVAAMLYAALRLFSTIPVKLIPAWGAVAATGGFSVALGVGLAHPAVWRQHDYLTHPLIATLGILMAGLPFVCGRLRDKQRHPDLAMRRVETLIQLADWRVGATQRWAKDRLLGIRSFLGVSWQKAAKRFQRILDWQKPVDLVGGWNGRITMFALLGLALAWLAG